jgi:hypothetical protein
LQPTPGGLSSDKLLVDEERRVTRVDDQRITMAVFQFKFEITQ